MFSKKTWFWVFYLTVLCLWIVIEWTLFKVDLMLSQAHMDRGSEWATWIEVYGTKVIILLLVLGSLWAWWKKQKSLIFLSMWVQFIGHAVIITGLIKHMAGRVRPRTLIDTVGWSHFDTWMFFGQGRSFPSGHVATAMVLFAGAWSLWEFGQKSWASVLGLFALGYAALVAWGRVRMGAHFPSDVWFSYGLGILLAPWSTALASKIEEKFKSQ